MEIGKIYCEDCLETMARMPDDLIDLTVTSPPYDNLRTYNGYKFEFEKIAKELYRITKDGGIVVWVVGDETRNFCESLSSFKQAIFFVEQCNFNLLDTMIYHKLNYAPAYPNLKRYANVFEYMLIISKGKPITFNPLQWVKKESSFERAKYPGIGMRQRDGSITKSKFLKNIRETKDACNLWSIATDKAKDAGDHPAVFPEQLAEDHIKSWSNENDLVYDPMCGSGTVPKMAMKLNRKWVASEISQQYVDLANKRIKQYQEQMTLLD